MLALQDPCSLTHLQSEGTAGNGQLPPGLHPHLSPFPGQSRAERVMSTTGRGQGQLEGDLSCQTTYLHKLKPFTEEDAPTWPCGYQELAAAGSPSRVAPPGLWWHRLWGSPDPSVRTHSRAGRGQGAGTALALPLPGHTEAAPASSLAGAASRAVPGLELPPLPH